MSDVLKLANQLEQTSDTVLHLCDVQVHVRVVEVEVVQSVCEGQREREDVLGRVCYCVFFNHFEALLDFTVEHLVPVEHGL